MRTTLLAGLITAQIASSVSAQELTPPVVAEPSNLPQASTSVGTNDILISVLAALLVWAAVQQNERAK